jgi:serine/threonine protein phosphatase PrpC
VSSFKVNVCVAQHIGDRQEQQDRAAIITSPRNPGAMLAIVADGMGGRTGGRLAADQVVSTAENLFKDMTDRDSTYRDMLLHLAAEAHTVIRLTAIAAEKEPHSTLCALIIKKNYAIWAHAGDSRLYFFRNGRLVHRTEDHTYAEQLRLEGRHEDADMAAGRYKNILVSALGINKKPRIVIGE